MNSMHETQGPEVQCLRANPPHRSNLDRAAQGRDSDRVPPRPQASRKGRPPRIRVPNREQVLFTINDHKFVGVVQRLSLTGGSAIVSKGPIAHGTWGDMALNTVYGRVTAQVEFLQTGADGVPLAQAFRFISMDDVSTKRFSDAAKQMEIEGFSDAQPKRAVPRVPTGGLDELLGSVRRLAALFVSRKET